jgi:hypothetical protein
LIECANCPAYRIFTRKILPGKQTANDDFPGAVEQVIAGKETSAQQRNLRGAEIPRIGPECGSVGYAFARFQQCKMNEVVKKAEMLLRAKNVSLTDVALESGFCSHPHLSRSFQERTV